MSKNLDWDALLKELEQTLKTMTPQDWEEWEVKRAAGAAQYEAAQRMPTRVYFPTIVSSIKVGRHKNSFSEAPNNVTSQDVTLLLAA